MSCEHCHDMQSVPTEQLSLWDGLPCQVRHCPGSYRPDPRGGLPLYRRLYQRGAVHRIVAREHTGLLERLQDQGLVPEALAPPNGCCPTTAPVGLSLT